MTISMKIRAGAISTCLAALLMGNSASAETFAEKHPHRAEVNHRLAIQNHRINVERREGEISGAQARALHRQDQFVRREERFHGLARWQPHHLV